MSSSPRIVVITGATGATGGIGRAFVRVFAGQGDRVVLTGLDEHACPKLAAECGNGSMGRACDLGDPAVISAFWAWMDAEVGAPDVILNNAGIAPGYVLMGMVATLSSTGRIDLDAVRRRVPLGRLARPDEMATVARVLAAPEGAGCTGQTLAVDGGWSAFNMGGDACPGALSAPPLRNPRRNPTGRDLCCSLPKTVRGTTVLRRH